MKLISMREFVLEQDTRNGVSKTLSDILSYAEFLSQPITLGMFVPCDLEGNLLAEPKWVAPYGVKWDDYVNEYQQAKERVLFEGVELVPISEHGSYILRCGGFQIGYYKALPNYFTWDFKVIEEICGKEIKLTQRAIKQLEL